MGDCSSNNCNPCGPDYNAINQLATKTAAYARQANTYSVDAANSAQNAQNSFLEFNALYLGAFASAPLPPPAGNPIQEGALYWNSVLNNLWVWNGTMWMPAVEGELYLGGFSVAPLLNNQGLPLQSGNLYWNTVSNNLWAYNGTSWVVTNFNEFTNFMLPSTTPVGATNLVNGLQYEIAVVGTTNWVAIGASSATIGVRFTKNAVAATGTGTARRTRDLVERFVDVANVRDWGAYGDGIADDTIAIQNAINSSNNPVFFPAGQYRVTAPIFVRSDNATLFGAGGRFSDIRINHNGNGIVFEPAGAGVSNVFLNNVHIRDISVSRPGTITSPADNIWIRQCNGFTARGVQSLNGSTCFRFTGGQLNSLLQCRAFVGNTTIVPQADNGLVIFENATLSGGGYQPCYTTSIDDFNGSASGVLDYGIKVKSIDGLNFSNSYMSYCSGALIGIIRENVDSAATGINLTNVYLDCTGGSGGTPYGIFCNHSIVATQYGVAGMNVSNCVIANNNDTGTFNSLVQFAKRAANVNFSNCYFANSGSPWGIQLYDAGYGGRSGKYVFTGNTFFNLSLATGGGGGALYAKDVDFLILTGNTFANTSTAAYQVLCDGDCGSITAIGNIADASTASIVTISGTVAGDAVLLNAGTNSSANIIRLALPTSSAGLPSGSMWNNAGNVQIVP